MNLRKTNNTLWYSLGLVALLCSAALIVATGTTLARYRSEEKTRMNFQVRPPAKISLGTMRLLTEEEAQELGASEVFDSSIKPAWILEDDMINMNLVVANGTGETDFSDKAQTVRIRVIGSLALMSETEAGVAELSLVIPPEAEEAEAKVYRASAIAIEPGSLLYNTYGAGWIYRFQDENGQELSWTLLGGSFSYVELSVVMDNAEVADTSLLQLQIIGELVNQ